MKHKIGTKFLDKNQGLRYSKTMMEYSFLAITIATTTSF
jgi:hypothetical protein